LDRYHRIMSTSSMLSAPVKRDAACRSFNTLNYPLKLGKSHRIELAEPSRIMAITLRPGTRLERR
jgi:hypothetical protein